MCCANGASLSSLVLLPRSSVRQWAGGSGRVLGVALDAPGKRGRGGYFPPPQLLLFPLLSSQHLLAFSAQLQPQPLSYPSAQPSMSSWPLCLLLRATCTPCPYALPPLCPSTCCVLNNGLLLFGPWKSSGILLGGWSWHVLCAPQNPGPGTPLTWPAALDHLQGISHDCNGGWGELGRLRVEVG